MLYLLARSANEERLEMFEKIDNCELCGIKTENHASIFWNCLCLNCWNKEKETK